MFKSLQICSHPKIIYFPIWPLGDRSKDTPVSWQMADTYHATEQQGSTATKPAARYKILIQRKTEHMKQINLPDYRIPLYPSCLLHTFPTPPTHPAGEERALQLRIPMEMRLILWKLLMQMIFASKRLVPTLCTGSLEVMWHQINDYGVLHPPPAVKGRGYVLIQEERLYFMSND